MTLWSPVLSVIFTVRGSVVFRTFESSFGAESDALDFLIASLLGV